MAKDYEEAYAEWPLTKILNDGGIQVYGKYVQPMLPRQVFGLSCIAGAVVAVYVLSVTEAPGPALGAIIASIVAYYAFRPVLYDTFGKNVDVKIYPDRIALRQGFGYKNYSRQYPIEFRAEDHEKAVQEQANAIRTGNDSFRVFREALQVVMQYGEKRIPLAEMRLSDLEKAKALVIRLQNVCNSLDEAVRHMADGKVRPAGEERATVGDFGASPPIR